jgi:hypothetical protein
MLIMIINQSKKMSGVHVDIKYQIVIVKQDVNVDAIKDT